MSTSENRNPFNQRRRMFMQSASAAGVSLAGGLAGTLLAENAQAEGDQIGDPWQQAQDIIDRLATPPSFPDRDFPITEYGAVSCELTTVTAWVTNEDQAQLKTPVQGSKDAYPAIAAAIAACHKAGGGRVVIPAGNWYCCGPIVLLSNVHVHLKAGAHVYFSNNPADFAKYGPYDCGKNGKLTLTRWQGNDLLNFSSLVYAHGQNNIALTGEDWSSILDGQGGVPFADAENGRDCWWTWKGRLVNHPQPPGTPQIYVKGQPSETTPNPLNASSLLEVAPAIGKEQAQLIEGDTARWRSDFGYVPALSEAGVPAKKRIFGLGHYLRPHMLQFVSCTNVWLQGYQTTNTPFWQHNPIDCHNMLVKKVYANSLGPNNDGFDPECCSYVLIDSCAFNTGDDCIAINAGKDLDTQYGPAQNIVVQNCVMQSGHGALTLGSEMAGGVQNIYAQNLVFQNINWATNPLNIAIRLKTNMNRGGYLRNMYVRNVSIPNGVRVEPGFYKPLKGTPVSARNVATTAGGVITIDSDYAPNEDNVRTRPSEVSNVHISGVKVGNVATQGGHYSSYQALVIQGQVGAEYNGPGQRPAVSPVTDITISDCDFGTPFLASEPYYLYNAQNVKLKNVTIGGKVYNTTLSAKS